MSKRLLANVNEDTFKKIKTAFVQRGITMQDAVVKATLMFLDLDMTLEEATKGIKETTTSNENEDLEL